MRKKIRPHEDELIYLDDIEIIDFEKIDLNGATAIAGFPSIGLVSTIVANYLIESFGLKEIGALHSAQFPPLSVVHDGEPLSPVRIYAGRVKSGEKIAVFVSEFRPKPNLIYSLSNAIMDWVAKKGCKLLISPEGMVLEGEPSEEEETIASAYAIGSTINAQRILLSMNIPQFKNGIIAGVSGVLLNKGQQAGLDVIAILAEAHPSIPDAGAAASALSIIASLLRVEINISPLYDEAKRIEKQLQKFYEQAEPMVSDQIRRPSMYE